jgi:hypothetical protein
MAAMVREIFEQIDMDYVSEDASFVRAVEEFKKTVLTG